MRKITELVLNTHELSRRAGELKQVRHTVGAPADLGVEMVGVLENSPIELDLTLQSAGDGILVTGTAKAHLNGSCVRCLNTFEYDASFNITQLYYYPGRETDEDAHYVVDDQIDLDPALREAIVLELPINPLCLPQCYGLCCECGFNLNENPEHNHRDTPTAAR
ncbi:MAG: YceD family protein [Propionibacteriaceae bacterium]|jgi:uncharacterized protein|nr:YceD family protein [Propionibacteriaceae bacterium]